ncbi:MAG TPA: PRC-barrel domain-containing protein [Gemmatimonadaceae bacterium]|nr:PRC-barrel domain-containing protein [Gemmatimonadaceae bacterium]
MAKHEDKRIYRDQAGVGPDPSQVRHLTPLRDVDDFRIAPGEPDIRGWDVYTSAGRELGEVDDLLVDPTRNQVVMLDIDLRGTDRHSLAPIRAAWIDREHKRVVLDTAQLPADAAFPSLARHGNVSDEEWRRFGEGYDRVYGERGWDDDGEWRLRHSGEEVRWARRRQDDREREQAVQEAAREAEARTRRDQHDVVVERRQLADSERTEPRSSESREVRYAAPAEGPMVIEEHIVRRRVVDPSELSDAERERLARERRDETEGHQL